MLTRLPRVVLVVLALLVLGVPGRATHVPPHDTMVEAGEMWCYPSEISIDPNGGGTTQSPYNVTPSLSNHGRLTLLAPGTVRSPPSVLPRECVFEVHITGYRVPPPSSPAPPGYTSWGRVYPLPSAPCAAVSGSCVARASADWEMVFLDPLTRTATIHIFIDYDLIVSIYAIDPALGTRILVEKDLVASGTIDLVEPSIPEPRLPPLIAAPPSIDAGIATAGIRGPS